MCSCNNVGYLIGFTLNIIGNTCVWVGFLDISNIHETLLMVLMYSCR